jgi:hypothetical protein
VFTPYLHEFLCCRSANAASLKLSKSRAKNLVMANDYDYLLGTISMGQLKLIIAICVNFLALQLIVEQ